MGSLSGTDLRGVLGFLWSAAVGTPSAPLSRETLVGLRDLLGADEAECFELGRVDRTTIALTASDPTYAEPGTDEAMLAFSAQNPIGWLRWRPADGARRLSAQVGGASSSASSSSASSCGRTTCTTS